MSEYSMQRRYRWGCLVPIVLLIGIYWICRIVPYETNVIDIGNGELFLKLERFGVNKGARLYVSRSKNITSDYIDFNYTQITAPKIYFVSPDTIYMVDEDGFYIKQIKSKEVIIKYINHVYPEDLTLSIDSVAFCDYLREHERISEEDSILRAKSRYCIYFYDNASGIYVFDAEGQLVLREACRIFFLR